MIAIEIFGHHIQVSPSVDAEGVLMVEGKTWDEDSFRLYLRDDEAKSLLVQLGYHLYDETGAD